MLSLFRNIFAPPRDLILLVAASWCGLILTEKRTGRYHIEVSAISDLIFTEFIAYIFGGRIFYVSEHIPAFLESPVSLISLNLDLFDIWGALITAALSGFVFGWRKKCLFYPLLMP
jgi:prolipoprotein diacylglyceryltransferase